MVWTAQRDNRTDRKTGRMIRQTERAQCGRLYGEKIGTPRVVRSVPEPGIRLPVTVRQSPHRLQAVEFAQQGALGSWNRLSRTVRRAFRHSVLFSRQ